MVEVKQFYLRLPHQSGILISIEDLDPSRKMLHVFCFYYILFIYDWVWKNNSSTFRKNFNLDFEFGWAILQEVNGFRRGSNFKMKFFTLVRTKYENLDFYKLTDSLCEIFRPTNKVDAKHYMSWNK